MGQRSVVGIAVLAFVAWVLVMVLGTAGCSAKTASSSQPPSTKFEALVFVGYLEQTRTPKDDFTLVANPIDGELREGGVPPARWARQMKRWGDAYVAWAAALEKITPPSYLATAHAGYAKALDDCGRRMQQAAAIERHMLRWPHTQVEIDAHVELTNWLLARNPDADRPFVTYDDALVAAAKRLGVDMPGWWVR